MILILESILENQFTPTKISKTLNTSKHHKNPLNYILNNVSYCRDQDILAIFVITSYEGHIELRSAIRRAVPDTKLREMKLKRIFLLGKVLENDQAAVSQQSIQSEYNRFGDIIQGDFLEAYRNLTIKNLMGLSWVSNYCPNAKFIIKMDDDIVFDFHKVVKKITELNPAEDFMMGYVYRGVTPKRDLANKWYVSYTEYTKMLYPPYLSGWFYITTPRVASQLANLSEQVPYFWVEDVYITGMLVNALKIQLIDVQELFTANSAFLECCMRDYRQYKYHCDVVVGPNGGDNNLIFKFNQVMGKCQLEKECVERPEEKSTKFTCVAEFKELPINAKGDSLIENVPL